MSDLPQDNQEVAEPDVHPLKATIEAMQRLKERNEVLEERVGNLEDMFKMAFAGGSEGFSKFLERFENASEQVAAVEGGEDSEPESEESEEVQVNPTEDKAAS